MGSRGHRGYVGYIYMRSSTDQGFVLVGVPIMFKAISKLDISFLGSENLR